MGSLEIWSTIRNKPKNHHINTILKFYFFYLWIQLSFQIFINIKNHFSIAILSKNEKLEIDEIGRHFNNRTTSLRLL